MTYSDTQPRGTPRYRLLAASLRPAWPTRAPGATNTTWRRIHREQDVDETVKKDKDAPAPAPLDGTLDDLRALAKECAVFLIGHNAEPEAVDLLEELEIVDEIAQLVDDNTYNRVCQYMIRCVNLLPPPDNVSFLRTAHTIYAQHHKFPEALALAIRLGDPALIREDFNAPGNPLMKRQLAFLLARAQIPIEWLRAPSENPDEEIAPVTRTIIA
ncbi:hypothetical protein C8J57DRAFT_1573401 [Mycena rebaudengoi]|nr:hypothetical protein C8J57DRAFT_1573401 [Mycena rebaudengoi]